MIDFIFFTSLAILLYWLIVYPYGYWKRKGVPNPKPSIFFGNIGPSLCMKKNIALLYKEIYDQYRNSLYVGYYKFRQPGIILIDIELIKKVLINDFTSFYDNDLHVDINVDPYFGNNPFCLKGKTWKHIRSLITSAITSSKIKNMFYLMSNVSKSLVEYISKNLENSAKFEIEAKVLASKFTTDVVASCAFGLEANSFLGQSEFETMGKKFLAPTFFSTIRQMCLFLIPNASKLFHIKLMPKEVEDWFTTIVKKTVNYRETNNINRKDYLDLLIGLRNNLNGFTETHIVAQALTFYTDGYETSAITLSHTLFELASNIPIQKKLRNEIKFILKKYNEQMSYEAVQEMNYLDNVILETLRKHAPLGFMVRLCTKEYVLPSPIKEETNKRVILSPGTPVVIPVRAIHYDSEYYPDPEVFNPDRFTVENRNSRPKATFLAFGEGPRICFGSKFGLAQVKAAIIAIISNFDVTLNEKTQIPLNIHSGMFFTSPVGGLWINLVKCEDS